MKLFIFPLAILALALAIGFSCTYWSPEVETERGNYSEHAKTKHGTAPDLAPSEAVMLGALGGLEI